MIEVVGDGWIACSLDAVLILTVVVVNLVIEPLAFAVEVLELADGGVLIVVLLVNGVEFPLNSLEVLFHMEDAEVSLNIIHPLIHLGLLLDERIVGK